MSKNKQTSCIKKRLRRQGMTVKMWAIRQGYIPVSAEAAAVAPAISCINLVGKTVRPAHGTERWAFANGSPQSGKVIDVHIPGLERPFAVVRFGNDIVFMCAFELEIVEGEK